MTSAVMREVRAMKIECVVLDFDGTFTDVDLESAPFEPAFRAALSDLLGRDVTDDWEAERARILANPNAFGWEYDGKVVAPATADPYLVGTATVQGLLNRAALLRNPVVRSTVTHALYQIAYERTLTAFKPEAKEVLEALLDTGIPVHVVTNSNTDAVSKKIDQLGLAKRKSLEVVGDAKKYWVTETKAPDATFLALPAYERGEGLKRPIYVRRGCYYDILRKLWSDTKSRPESTLVVGDIYELDLALPAALGAKIALVKRKEPLAYELERTRAHGGKAIDSLREVLPMLGLAGASTKTAKKKAAKR